MKTAVCVSRRKFWLVFLQNLRLFLQVWANSYRSFDRKVSPLFSKQNSTCSEEQLEKKASFTLLSYFLFWVNSSSSFGKSTSAGLPKLNWTFPGETFSIFFWKTYNFAYFSDLKRKKYSNITENYRHRCQATFDVSQETNCGKIPTVESFVAVIFSQISSHFFALLTGKFGRFIRTVCLPVRCTVCGLFFKISWFFENYWNWAETH